MTDDAIKGIAGKAGYCDAIMGRAPENGYTGHYDRLKYDKGYSAGKESGVVCFTAKEQLKGGTARSR